MIAVLAMEGEGETVTKQLLRLSPSQFYSEADYRQALARQLGPERAVKLLDELSGRGFQLFQRHIGEITGFAAKGFLGQFLVVVPSTGIVAARMILGK